MLGEGLLKEAGLAGGGGGQFTCSQDGEGFQRGQREHVMFRDLEVVQGTGTPILGKSGGSGGKARVNHEDL